MLKRLLAVLVAMGMFLICLPVTANAEESPTITLDANGGYLLDQEGNQVETLEYSVAYGARFSRFAKAYSYDSGKGLLGWSRTKGGEPEYDEDSLANIVVTKSEVFYAVYSEYITVTLDGNGGYFWNQPDTTQTTFRIPAGRRMLSDYSTPISAAENMGLAGWSHSPDGAAETEEYLYHYVTSVDETLYAVWAEAYTVTFNGNGGMIEGMYDQTESYSVKVVKGKTINNYIRAYNEDETKTFVGWAYSPDGEPAFDFESIHDFMPTGNVTLYAIWQSAYTIILDANGGYFWDENNTVEVFQTAQGSPVDMNIYPSHSDSGKAFVGWSHTPDGEAEIGEYDLSDYVPSRSETLYAVWKDAYVITLNANGGYFRSSGSSEMIVQVAKGEPMTAYSSPVTDDTDKVFAGWSRTPDGEVELQHLYNYVPTDNETLYAVWTEAYTITLVTSEGYFYDEYTGGKTTAKSIKVLKGSNVARSIEVCNDDPHRAPAGFSSTENGEVIITVSHFWNYVPESSETLYVVWADGYTVTFDANGGWFYSLGTPTSTVTQAIVKDGYISHYGWPEAPDGLDFLGWSDTPDGEIIYDIFNYQITKDVTLYAIYGIDTGGDTEEELEILADEITNADNPEEAATFAEDLETVKAGIEEAINNGETLVVELNNELIENVDQEEKALILEALADENAVMDCYDLSLLLKTSQTDIVISEITETNTPITVRLPLSEEAKAAGGEYRVIRVHEGEAEELDCELSEDGEYVIFRTDKFSTYAVAYSKSEMSVNVYGVSLALEGKIGANFYLEIDEADKEELTVVMTLNGKEKRVKASEGHKAQGYMMYSCPVNALQMRDTITLTIEDSEGKKVKLLKGTEDYTEGYDFKVVTYYEKAEELDDEIPLNAKLKALTRVMNNYGKYAQINFKYNVDEEVKNVETITGVTLEKLKSYEVEKNDEKIEGLEYVGVSTMLQDAIGYRHYFKTTDGHNIDEYSFTVDGTEIQPTELNGQYYIEVTGINANKMGEKKTIAVTDGKNTISIKFCVLSYVYKVLELADPTMADLQNLCKAIYVYYLEAVNYLGA